MNMQVQTPPQPPPQPPPMPPLNQQPLAYQPNRSPHASSIIRPTKAGLMQYQNSEEWDEEPGQMRLVPHSPLPDVMNSRLFKDELLERQSRLSGVNSNSTIEERIRQRKNEVDERLLSPSSNPIMPEKLMSTLQREKKPFAYTPDVNDPNNRGKLDLSQIKSPIMRRRLLANMESSESNEESPDEGEPKDLYNKDRSSETFNGNTVARIYAPTDQKPEPKHHPQSNGYSHSQATYSPAQQPASVQRQTVQNQESVIRYNEPPVFYSTNYNTAQSQPARPIDSDRSAMAKNCFDELNDEVAKSLDSLSLLVDSLQNQGQMSGSLQRQQQECEEAKPYAGDEVYARQHVQQQQPSYQRMSTFSPGISFNSSPGTMNTRLNSRSSSSSPAYRSPSDRSFGDYLLAPDSNYFSMGSSSSPYSVSPYYGSPLGIENYGHTRDFTQVKQISAKTFSPHYSSTNKSHYYYRGNMNNQPATAEQQFRQY